MTVSNFRLVSSIFLIIPFIYFMKIKSAKTVEKIILKILISCTLVVYSCNCISMLARQGRHEIMKNASHRHSRHMNVWTVGTMAAAYCSFVQYVQWYKSCHLLLLHEGCSMILEQLTQNKNKTRCLITGWEWETSMLSIHNVTLNTILQLMVVVGIIWMKLSQDIRT